MWSQNSWYKLFRWRIFVVYGHSNICATTIYRQVISNERSNFYFWLHALLKFLELDPTRRRNKDNGANLLAHRLVLNDFVDRVRLTLYFTWVRTLRTAVALNFSGRAFQSRFVRARWIRSFERLQDTWECPSTWILRIIRGMNNCRSGSVTGSRSKS